ncbi:OmpA family protein [Suttonella ornithocola]|uniref:Outer membrane protein II n=1 Tax=Suttonella ornithocola TaxID=279832 RepID=A0A380MY04_9GAMM|nr:OmpA family protein [Suttonella ornithocola]SUO96317.1 Outer membrane protein II* [Suttonella ornithocola]
MKLHFSLLAIVIFLTACSTGTVIQANGSPKGDLVWPKSDSVQMDYHKGTFPNLENLSNIREGVTREQLYNLIGRPHFSEGFHVREWDYLFYFNTPGIGDNGVSTCEFKVLFDKELYARNFYWKPINPVDGVCPPFEKEKSKYSLSADALFAFDKSGLDDIRKQGRRELDNLVNKLKSFTELNKITVTGYADRLGAESYNLVLSQARAETVAEYLIRLGVPAEKITAEGLGESNPIVTCHQSDRALLINCLAPNRRVIVDIDGFKVLK